MNNHGSTFLFPQSGLVGSKWNAKANAEDVRRILNLYFRSQRSPTSLGCGSAALVRTQVCTGVDIEVRCWCRSAPPPSSDPTPPHVDPPFRKRWFLCGFSNYFPLFKVCWKFFLPWFEGDEYVKKAKPSCGKALLRNVFFLTFSTILWKNARAADFRNISARLPFQQLPPRPAIPQKHFSFSCWSVAQLIIKNNKVTGKVFVVVLELQFFAKFTAFFVCFFALSQLCIKFTNTSCYGRLPLSPAPSLSSPPSWWPASAPIAARRSPHSCAESLRRRPSRSWAGRLWIVEEVTRNWFFYFVMLVLCRRPFFGQGAGYLLISLFL